MKEIAAIAAEVQHRPAFKRHERRKKLPVIRRVGHALLEILFVGIKPGNDRRSGAELSQWSMEGDGNVVAEGFREVHVYIVLTRGLYEAVAACDYSNLFSEDNNDYSSKALEKRKPRQEFQINRFKEWRFSFSPFNEPVQS